jgi:hypothetical protein
VLRLALAQGKIAGIEAIADAMRLSEFSFTVFAD